MNMPRVKISRIPTSVADGRKQLFIQGVSGGIVNI